MTTNTLPRPVKAHPRVIDDVLALAEHDWAAAVHEAWRIGLITAAHLHWAFEHGADVLDVVRGRLTQPAPNPWGEHNPNPKRRRSFDDLVAALAENRPTTFAIHAPAAEEGVR